MAISYRAFHDVCRRAATYLKGFEDSCSPSCALAINIPVAELFSANEAGWVTASRLTRECETPIRHCPAKLADLDDANGVEDQRRDPQIERKSQKG